MAESHLVPLGLALPFTAVPHESRAGERTHSNDAPCTHRVRVGRVDAALEAVRRVRVHRVTAPGAAHGSRVEGGHLEDDLRGRGVDGGPLPAHHARDRHGRGRIGDDEVVVDERARDPVEPHEGLTGLRAANFDAIARDLLAIEGVHRMAEEEERLVRDVDEARDGARAERLEAKAQIERRRAVVRAREQRVGVVVAALGRRERHVDRFGAASRGLRAVAGRQGERNREERADLARESHVPEGVGTVRRDGELVDPVLEGGPRFGEARTGGREISREDQDALAFFRETELLLAAEHALARHAAYGARRDRQADGRQHRAERREHDEAAGLGHVRRTADDLTRAGAVEDRHQPKAAAARVRAERLHAHDEARRAGGAEVMDAFDLEAGVREGLLDDRGVVRERRDELAEPLVRCLHGGASLSGIERGSAGRSRRAGGCPRCRTGGARCARGPCRRRSRSTPPDRCRSARRRPGGSCRSRGSR